MICTLSGDKITINENTVWNSPKKNTLTILNGAQLTINTDVEFSPFGQIIVKPDAKLILDGATLTNACSGPWQGVQVWGDKNHSQYPYDDGNYYQGYLKLKNGAVIENAVCAVDLWKPDDWSSTGGIVYADGAVFRNNVKAVHN